MSLFEIIAEEWQKLAWFGRIVWFPVFVPLLLFVALVLIAAILPAIMLDKIFGVPIVFLCRKAKRLIYRES